MRLKFLPLSAAILMTALASCVTDGPDGARTVEEPRAAEDRPGAEPEQPETPGGETPSVAAETLGSVYDDAADSGEALAVIEETGIDDLDPDTRLVYAVLLRNEGRFDDSRDQLGLILDERPGMADAWFNLALLEHAVENEEARDEALDAAIEADDSFAEAYAFRGSIASSRSDWIAAESDFRKALEFDPESADSLAGLGWLMLNNGNPDEALSFLDRAVELDPDNAYVRVDRSRANVALEHYAAASNDLGRAIELEPDVAWHYLDRARIRFRYFNDLNGALADLIEVERLDPDNFFALVYLAGVHEQQRRFRTSLEYYNRVVEARPDYIWAYMPLGKLEWMAGDFEASATWYAKASAEDPDEFSFAMMTGISLLESGKPVEAGRIFTEVAQSHSRGGAIYETARFCADRNSDYFAVNALNKESDDELRERLWFYIGAVYDAMGNETGAQAVYERIAEKTGHMEFDMAWAALNGMGG